MKNKKAYMTKEGTGQWVVYQWDEHVGCYRSGISQNYFAARATIGEIRIEEKIENLLMKTGDK